MINIKDKKDCCGCNACIVACPQNCISRNIDDEGFWYPIVNTDACIDCSLCEKVCPEIIECREIKPLSCYASINSDLNIRLNSSSGGVFYELAKYVIANEGVVFGAKFDENWSVVHDRADNLDSVSFFRGSKYVQSDTKNTFKTVKKLLKSDKLVLYSGTPCQIAGLRLYLRKDYENLILVDFICHGVPSPLVWDKYLNSLSTTKDNIQSIFFRNKKNGWKNFGLEIRYSDKIHYKPLNKDLFIRGFLKDLYLRPSCYACPSKGGKSGSDITLADFWGIQNVMPEIDDNKGTSAILVNTEKGKILYDLPNVKLYDCLYEDVLKQNSALVKSVQRTCS